MPQIVGENYFLRLSLLIIKFLNGKIKKYRNEDLLHQTQRGVGGAQPDFSMTEAVRLGCTPVQATMMGECDSEADINARGSPIARLCDTRGPGERGGANRKQSYNSKGPEGSAHPADQGEESEGWF